MDTARDNVQTSRRARNHVKISYGDHYGNSALDYINTLHLVQALLRSLLRLLRDVRVVEGRLQSTSIIAGVLSLHGIGASGPAIKLIHKDIARVLLALLRCVYTMSTRPQSFFRPVSDSQHKKCVQDLLGLLRLALWPPMTFPELFILVKDLVAVKVECGSVEV